MENEIINDKKAVCSCIHHKILGILIALFGLTFLLLQLNVFTQTFVDFAWPVLVIAAGVFKMGEYKCRCC